MRHPFKLILRFMLIGLLLSVITYQWGYKLIKLLIPLYEWVIRQLDYRLDMVMLQVTTEHQQQSLSLATTLSQPFMLGAELITPQYALVSGGSMPLGNVLLPVILVFTTVLAWPSTINRPVMRIYCIRILLAVPLCLLIMLLDMPTQLLKMVWESLNKLLNLSISSDLPYFTYWSDFLNGGGLMAFSIAAGLLVVGISNRLVNLGTTGNPTAQPAFNR